MTSRLQSSVLFTKKHQIKSLNLENLVLFFKTSVLLRLTSMVSKLLLSWLFLDNFRMEMGGCKLPTTLFIISSLETNSVF